LDPNGDRQIEKNLTEVIRLVALRPEGQEVIDLVRETRDLTRQSRSRSGVDDTELADGEPAMSGEPGAILYRDIGLVEVHRRWLEQQTMNANDALCILRGEPGDVISQRVRSRIPEPAGRATALIEALGEIEKVSLLLSAPLETTRVMESDILFTPGTSGNMDNWAPHGDFELTPRPDGFRFTNTEREWHDAMMWTQQTFDGNHSYRTGFTPHTGPGGVIFAICGTPKPGKDLSFSAREPMEPYNTGIDAYHVSVYREGTGMTNLRRPGSGLKMLATQNPDPCDAAERTYEIRMLRFGRSRLFLVDDVLIHHYVDAGIYGPCLEEGHIGIRHWRNTEASYTDFTVSRLENTAAENP
jgi:hypothetical protein